jgi:hypothetical protein
MVLQKSLREPQGGRAPPAPCPAAGQKPNTFVNLHKVLPFRNFCKVLESFLQFFAVQNSIPWNRFPYTELCRAWPFRTAESGICDSRAAI